MAIMIPDSCPSKATAGEKRVFQTLRDALPDDFTVWYEPVVAGRYPDFSVLSPDFGLLMLEVKGWMINQITSADSHQVELRRNRAGEVRVERHDHPIRQVREYLFALIDQIRRPEYAILHQTAGEHRGKPGFPCGFGVILTHITRAQLEKAGLSPLFPVQSVLCRDELDALAIAGDREVIRRFRGLFGVQFPFSPLTQDQIRTLKGILHHEVIVRRKRATRESLPPDQPLLPGAVALEVLDHHQEQVARAIGTGHQVLFGIAGSGKTVALMARARLIASRDSDKRVLFLCYNKVLAAHLRDQLEEDPCRKAIEIAHFHSWAARKTGLRWDREAGEVFEAYEARVVSSLLEGIAHFSEAEKYDAILIDEGHDFEPNWLRAVIGLLKDGGEGNLVIAVDGAQSLYGRSREFTWKSIGVHVQGRSRRLSRNYRNTKQILEFAWQVTQSMIGEEADSETHVRVLPTKASRQGPIPRFSGCSTVAEEHERIVEIVDELRAKGFAASDVAVLYARRERHQGLDRVEALRQKLGESGEVCWINDRDAREGSLSPSARPGVRLMTIHAAKGLEFPAVIVSAVDQLPSPIHPDERRDCNLLYVALTRATNLLAVTWAGRSRFTERILEVTKGQQLPV